jgi:hypothetical protein
MISSPARYMQFEVEDEGSFTIDTTPPVTGRPTAPDTAAGVRNAQEFGAAACTVKAPAASRTTRVNFMVMTLPCTYRFRE